MKRVALGLLLAVMLVGCDSYHYWESVPIPERPGCYIVTEQSNEGGLTDPELIEGEGVACQSPLPDADDWEKDLHDKVDW